MVSNTILHSAEISLKAISTHEMDFCIPFAELRRPASFEFRFLILDDAFLVWNKVYGTVEKYRPTGLALLKCLCRCRAMSATRILLASRGREEKGKEVFADNAQSALLR